MDSGDELNPALVEELMTSQLFSVAPGDTLGLPALAQPLPAPGMPKHLAWPRDPALCKVGVEE